MLQKGMFLKRTFLERRFLEMLLGIRKGMARKIPLEKMCRQSDQWIQARLWDVKWVQSRDSPPPCFVLMYCLYIFCWDRVHRTLEPIHQLKSITSTDRSTTRSGSTYTAKFVTSFANKQPGVACVNLRGIRASI